jgi:hypothetical protein
MSIVLYDQKIDIPDTACFLDPPEVVRKVTGGKSTKIPKLTEVTPRDPTTDWIRGHVTHTTSGTVRRLDDRNLIESLRDWAFARYNVNKDDKSWTLTKDLDTTAIQSYDPGRGASWHAAQVNRYTDGWELVQTPEGTLTQVQLEGYVRLCDEWSYHCGIPRVIAWRNGRPYAGMLTRALSAHGAGASLCLFYGHRNIWSIDKNTGKLRPQRGEGDPSDLPFLALKAAGYLALDVEAGEDLQMWKDLQAQLGLDPDGIPGPLTRAALIRDGRYGKGGMLVPRPGDESRGVPAWLKARPVEWRQRVGLA